MDIRLIKANIALFKGDRTETQRLIQEYRRDNHQDDPHQAMVMWLEAQAQTKREEHIHLLNMLTQSVDANNTYVQMANDYLEDEKYYWEKLNPKRQWSIWQVVLIVLILGCVTLGSYYWLTQRPQSEANTIVDVPPTPTQQATPLGPDRSQLLVSDSYVARYPAGILQIVALEDGSERIIDSRSLTQVTPVPGARFYALRIIFECREAICNAPPQAALTLRLKDEQIVTNREGLQLATEAQLEPIALGRTTSGWVIFEIPIISQVNALIITSQDASGNNLFEPLIIQLPAG